MDALGNAVRSVGAGLAVLLVGLSACGQGVYTGREDIAAEAGRDTLMPDRLATWIARTPTNQPTISEAGFVALAWTDYSLLAQAVAGNVNLADSARAASALAPDLLLIPLRRWHDTLVARRPRVASDRPDSLFAEDNLRVFQQIFIRVSDPDDIRAIAAVRDRAESLMVRARAPGQVFDSLARAHSEDASAQQGGWLPPARRQDFPPEFVRGSWRIKPGDINGVTSRGGFHIVRRPPLEEVRDRLRQYAETLATRKADSVYIDSLAAGRGLALDQRVPARLRAFFEDPSERTRDTVPLARWEGGALGLERASIWIDLLPPRGYLELRGASDVLLERFVLELAKQHMLLDEATRIGITVTPADWNALYAGYQRSLGASLALLGLGESTPSAAEASQRVKSLMDQLTSDSTRWRPLPSALGASLRASLGYRLHQRGLEEAVERALAVTQGLRAN